MKKRKKLRMRNLIDRWTPMVFCVVCMLKVLQFFKKCGVRAKTDGWRHLTSALFRTEHSKFSLAAFRLDMWSDISPPPPDIRYDEAFEHFLKRFSLFLQSHKQINYALDWGRFSVRGIEKKFQDLLYIVFDAEGQIISVECMLQKGDPRVGNITAEAKHDIVQEIVAAYNKTKHFPDTLRPIVLKKYAQKRIVKNRWYEKSMHDQVSHVIDRVLSSICIHFETLHDDNDVEVDRFSAVDFIRKKSLGGGVLNIFCRFSKSYREVDVWVQVNHIPVDGAPMQEFLDDLKCQWGVVGQCTIPARLLQVQSKPRICSTRKGLYAVYVKLVFIDFTKFLALRKKIATECADSLTGPVSVVGLVMWVLAHHPVFSGRKFLFTLDLEKTDTRVRRPGIVFIRPGKYIDTVNPRKGLVRYFSDVNAAITATLARYSESYELLELYAMFSPFIHSFIQACVPGAIGELVGTVGVSVLKNSDLFIAPSSDIHTGGFIALSNLSLPTDDGKTAGVVTIKGSRSHVEAYAQAIEEVMASCEQYA